MHENDVDPEDQAPSKSQRKRDMNALQDLGRRLLDTPAELLDRLALPERLRNALDEYKRLPNKNEAKRRQLQYIGKLMRDVDSETVTQALHDAEQGSQAQKRRLQRLEALRDGLLSDQPGSFEAVLQDCPRVELQQLRQLVRQAQQEAREERPPAARRKLFRYLRDSQEED